MKKFLISFLIFIFPFILLITGIEMYVIYYPSTFNQKAKFLHNNYGNIQTVILGSSHNQNALNPQFFNFPTANLANAGQDIQLDSALFFKHISQLKAVKWIILEMDYHSMEEINDSDYFRIPWYYRFYGIELYPVSLLHKLSVYSSSPSFFNKVLIDEINPNKIKYKINNYGFIQNDFPGVMEELKYDSVSLAQTAPDRLKDKHRTSSVKNFKLNRSKMDAIIQYCILHEINIFLVSTPMYSTYIDNEIAAKNQRRKNYIDSLIKLPKIHYYNFENSNRFSVKDFKNDDHLNSNGAKKFSVIIDSIVNHLTKNN